MSYEPRLSYALIDGVEVSELELLRYEVKRAQTAAFLLYEKMGAPAVASGGSSLASSMRASHKTSGTPSKRSGRGALMSVKR